MGNCVVVVLGGLLCCCSEEDCVVVFLGGVLSASDLEQLTEHTISIRELHVTPYVLLYSSAVSMATDLTYSRVFLVGAPSRGNPSH